MFSEHVTASRRRIRVLVVEDSFFAAQTLVRLVHDFGAEVVGPAPSVGRAMDLLEREGCDAAVLDINLGSETVEPVAEALDRLGRPFVFVTGYASPGFLSDRFKGHKTLPKPVEPETFLKTIAEEFAAA
jgi:two-component SAPR family response regulator